MEAKKQHWYQSGWFKESNWVSSSTKWFLTFSGKLARIVLIASTLYMSAELYPGVSFPAQLNLAMFIVLSFALDMGGLGLAQIAKQVRRNGHREEARKGEILSKWLITIMVAGLVAVSLENALRSIKALSGYQSTIDVLFMVIDIALTIARVICAVSYGHVLNELEQSIEQTEQTEQANDALVLEIDQRLKTLADSVHTLSTQYTTVCTQLSEMCTQIEKPVDMSVYTHRLDALEKMVNVSVTEVKQNILQITQNNLYTQAPTRVHEIVDMSTEEEISIPRLPERLSTSEKHDKVPALVVPGVSSQKVNEVLSAYLSGMSWRDIPGNYSRTIKPIREAYEAHIAVV